MGDTVETIYTEDKQRRALIEYDDDGSSSDPRDGDVVEIVTPRHDMTEHTDGAKFESQHDRLYEAGLGGAFGRYLKIFHNVDAVPVYRFEHGQVRLSTSDFRDRWDSGMIGWAYINPEAAWDGMDTKEIVNGMLEELTKWMNGDIYGYIIEKLLTGRKVFDDPAIPDERFDEWVEEEETGYVSDGHGGYKPIKMGKSCWGFLGLDYAIEQAKEALGIEEESNGTD